MSGGVDSAVAAALLRDAGHDVVGLFMKNWDDDDGTEYCTAADDLLAADAACHRLGIALTTVSFAAQYREDVFAHFLAEYRAGRTPNPDVLCNREIKFKVFAEHARALGADWIATGHYAALRVDGRGEQTLHCAADSAKDQTYFLCAVPRAHFRRVLFPLAGLTKPAIRVLARAYGLGNYARKDSTGICFIGERRFREFLARYLEAPAGAIVDEHGRHLGEHIGLPHYTLGQRQGIGIGGRRAGSGEPWYVAAKDTANNTLTVVQGATHPALLRSRVWAADWNWLVSPPPLPLHCEARTRYRQVAQPCIVETVGAARDDDSGRGDADSSAGSRDQLAIGFTTPQRAPTPGQYVVCYRNGMCLGGGVITRTA